ncbi:MAG: PQQ-binding-like beta-propeller repeat protein, partial [Proteobacteria bacterium]|nr:PQQ-binding-like beta-propeller repeat protein [Pseudomonadota bacterium]
MPEYVHQTAYHAPTAASAALSRNGGLSQEVVLTALDSRNGNLLWEFQTGAGMNAPVSAFEYNGHQHIVAYSAGNMFAGSRRGDSVWLFSPEGTLDEEPADSPADQNWQSTLETWAGKRLNSCLIAGVA